MVRHRRTHRERRMVRPSSRSASQLIPRAERPAREHHRPPAPMPRAVPARGRGPAVGLRRPRPGVDGARLALRAPRLRAWARRRGRHQGPRCAGHWRRRSGRGFESRKTHRPTQTRTQSLPKGRGTCVLAWLSTSGRARRWYSGRVRVNVLKDKVNGAGTRRRRHAGTEAACSRRDADTGPRFRELERACVNVKRFA